MALKAQEHLSQDVVSAVYVVKGLFAQRTLFSLADLLKRSAAGRGKRLGHYTGYKHLSGIKLQVVVNDRGEPVDVSDAHPASVHDHRIFRREWQRLSQRLDRTLPLLADKAYVGLDTLTEGQIQVPLKRGTRRQPAPTVERLSAKRVRVEHLFARLKCWEVLTNAHYHHDTVALMAQVILSWLIH